MQTVETLTSAELQRRWQAVTEDEELAAYAGRAELDAYGEVALTPPPSFVHQRIANELAGQMQAQLGGRAIVECPVLVDGVLTADAAWLSGERAMSMTSPAAERPEIVLEVSSPRNTKKGLRSKAARFLAHGAQEVVLVELDGTIRFITSAGESATSHFGLNLVLPPNSYPA
ncbi:MAG: Uma2 family endonuclease [Betaproteobacteria bacterium]